ncbi:MAG TPA: DNA polymerase III subunit delta [Lacipirellulaceae bacterium]|jgi:DNA polymerase-3 subunit delta|nr:DNA polymerase III subunit delta [Lacipirellulaceae bacterium]
MAKSRSAKSGAVTALEFLADEDQFPAASVCAVFGDDGYLKRESLGALRRKWLGGGDEEFSLSTFAGRETQLRDVLDALATVSLFGAGRRMAIVEEADTFVTQYRSDLEEYVARPLQNAVLVLEVKTFPSNTKLAKAIGATGLAINCDAPNERQTKSWLIQRAKTVHGMRLEAAAADELFELVPPEIGILVQELDKLALVAGDRKAIDVALVHDNVGGWRARTTWEMIDAAADGRAADALAQLDRVIASGEKPQGLLPQMASSLRRFASATSLIEAAEADRRRLPVRDALSQAGVPPFKLSDAERQLKQIGRNRAKQLTRWLLAADLATKGHNSSDERARIELERLIVRLASAPQAASIR